MRYSIVGIDENHQFFGYAKEVLGDVVPFPGDSNRMEIARGAIPKGDKGFDFSQAVIILTENTTDQLISDMEKLSKNKGVRVLKGYEIPNEFSHVDDMGMAVKEWVRNGSWPEEDIFSEDDLFGDEDDLFGDEPEPEPEQESERPHKGISANPRLAGSMNTNDGWGFSNDDQFNEVEEVQEIPTPPTSNEDNDDFPDLSDSDYVMEETSNDDDGDSDDSVITEFIEPDIDLSDIDEGPAKKGLPSNSGSSGLDDVDGDVGIESTDDDFEDIDVEGEFSISDVRDMRGEVDPITQSKIDMEDEEIGLGDILDPSDIQTPGDFQERKNEAVEERNRRLFNERISSDPGEVEKIHAHEEDDPPYFKHMNDAERVTQKERERSSRIAHIMGDDISPKSKMVFVTGTSGGVGKTTISYSLATFTAKAMKYLRNTGKNIEGSDRNVYLIEIDWSNSKLQNLLDSSNSLVTVIEAVKRNNKLKKSSLDTLILQSTSRQASGLHIIPAPHDDNYTSENFGQMLTALMNVLTYLMQQEEGSIIFLDSGNLEPVAKDKVARSIFAAFSPEVVLVTRLDAVSMVVKAKETLTTASEGKKVVGGKVVGVKGYGVPKEKINVIINRVPKDVDRNILKQMADEFRYTSPLPVGGFIPEMSSLRIAFVNQISESESQEIERLIGKFLAQNLGFPEFAPFVFAPEQKRNTPKPGFLKRILMRRNSD